MNDVFAGPLPDGSGFFTGVIHGPEDEHLRLPELKAEECPRCGETDNWCLWDEWTPLVGRDLKGVIAQMCGQGCGFWKKITAERAFEILDSAEGRRRYGPTGIYHELKLLGGKPQL